MRVFQDNNCFNRPYDSQSQMLISLDTQAKLYIQELINREQFDYTKWQREYFDAKTPEEISSEASRFEAEQPFVSDAVKL